MFSPRDSFLTRFQPVRSVPVPLLLCAALATAGCGRMLIGQLPVDGPDGASDPKPDAGAPVDVAQETLPDAREDARMDAPPADAGSDTPILPPNLPQVCTSDQWCWTHPLPSSDRLVRGYQVAPDDLWFIGASGTIVRYGGGVWSTLPSPTNSLTAIWASSDHDVWVGGAEGPYRWDGNSWTRIAPPTSPSARAVNAIWGCSPTDIWVMGVVATHWDGSVLSYVDMPGLTGNFRATWGTACNDVWAGVVNDALGSGSVLHWNGSNWSPTASHPAEEIVGTGMDDVWSLAQGQLYHWSGLGAGTLQDARTLGLFPVGAGAIGTLNDAHAVSIFPRGGAMSSLAAPAPDAVTALWGRARDDIWGLGARGLASHWDGSAWGTRLPAWQLSGDSATKITGSGAGDLWAVVGGNLLHGDGASWRLALAARDVGGRIYDVWARAADDVWVLGGDALIHRWTRAGDGSAAPDWQTIDPPPRGTTTLEMRAISGTGPSDVWVLRGRNSVLHWDGTSWISRQPFIDNLVDVWAPAPNEAWVAGDTVERWNGTGWSVPRLPGAIGTTTFTAVGGTGPTDVWLLAGVYVLKVAPDSWDVTVALSSSYRAAALVPAVTGTGVWVLVPDNTTGVSRLYHPAIPPELGTSQIAPAGLNDLWIAPDGTMWAAGDGGALIRKRPTP